MSSGSYARSGAAALAAFLLLLPPGAWSQGTESSRPQTASPAGVETPVTGHCTATKIAYRSTDSTDTYKTSNAFTVIPQMALGFTQGGAAPSCVILHFTAEVFAPRERAILVRARLDGSGAIGTPSDVVMSGDDDEDNDFRWARSHAAIFVFPNVAPGAHIVRLEWRAIGGAVSIHRRTMVVQHP